MKYLKQIRTVTLWEYQRFYKPKNELIGLLVGLIFALTAHYGILYLKSDRWQKTNLMIPDTLNSVLVEKLSRDFDLIRLDNSDLTEKQLELASTQGGLILSEENKVYTVHAYKKSKATKRLAKILKEFYRDEALHKLGLSPEALAVLDSPPPVQNHFVRPEKPLSRVVLAYAMVGLMVMAVFLSFAYQFTSITGEKQLRITEQIVSAVRPQVWMDGKILGITLTGLSSMVSYTLLSLVFGGIVLQFTGAPALSVLTFVHLPSLLLFLVFSLMGILLWNTVLAGIASVITDPNNSGKSSLMMIPVLFVAASFLIVSDPDGSLAVFLSWFPLSSASAMPIRWAVGDVPWWSLLGSWLLLTGTFYILRKVAAKVFRVSILISGKEPSWKEVFRWARED